MKAIYSNPLSINIRQIRLFIVTGMVSVSYLLYLPKTAMAKTENFLFIGGAEASSVTSKIDGEIDGVQVIYSWKSLETEDGKYDFNKIERDLEFLATKKKKLWLQLQDRFFDINSKSIPNYLLTEKIYDGGLAKQKDNPGESGESGQGWVTKQWNPNIRKKFQALIIALAKKFDGKIYGINLPETAADINSKVEASHGFTCDNYFNATVENINVARQAFRKSHVVQYVNFWPCEWDNDHNYMSRFFTNALDKNIGLGGPDIVPYRKGQMKNSYPFFNKNKNKLPIVAFAVQEPTRTYINQATKRRFTEQEFLDFAINYLGAKIIFWSIS